MSAHSSNFFSVKNMRSSLLPKAKPHLESSVDSIETCESDCQYSSVNRHMKVELCKNFSEKGYCPYGRRCRFAHGVNELQHKNSMAKFRTRPCRVFIEHWECRFGSRCNFQHSTRSLGEILGGSKVKSALRLKFSDMAIDMTRENQTDCSRLMQLLERSQK